ncbi:MAG: FxDxF family PEP-CTERM protein [Caulobacteraceae bacterium]
MKKSTTVRAVATLGVAAAALAIAVPASAATVYNSPFYHFVGLAPVFAFAPGDTGQFSSYTLTSGESTDALDFSFDLTPSSGNVLQQLQASLRSGSQSIAFDLYSGTPGSGTFLGASSPTITGPSLDSNLAPGDYYLQIVTNPPVGSLISGALSVTAVPEPATWAMLLAGFAFVGYAVRRRRTAISFA